MLALGRIVRGGLVVALAVALGGWTLERVRFGASNATAVARVEAEIQERIDTSAETLRTIAARAAAQREQILAAPRDTAASNRLFDALERALAGGRAKQGSPSTMPPTRRWHGRAMSQSRPSH